MRRWNPANVTAAENLVRGVIAKQPNFSAPYTLLATIQRNLMWQGQRSGSSMFEEHLALARKALEVDDLDPASHKTMARRGILGLELGGSRKAVLAGD